MNSEFSNIFREQNYHFYYQAEKDVFQSFLSGTGSAVNSQQGGETVDGSGFFGFIGRHVCNTPNGQMRWER